MVFGDPFPRVADHLQVLIFLQFRNEDSIVILILYGIYPWIGKRSQFDMIVFRLICKLSLPLVCFLDVKVRDILDIFLIVVNTQLVLYRTVGTTIEAIAILVLYHAITVLSVRFDVTDVMAGQRQEPHAMCNELVEKDRFIFLYVNNLDGHSRHFGQHDASERIRHADIRVCQCELRHQVVSSRNLYFRHSSFLIIWEVRKETASIVAD
mmetsp:Transcript_30594/g.55786  ORF Transcript_30594/g.55786 Transcript_30594/m.55786 type:complete len:209 (+) Transcript_30594:498-1124(+)